MGIGTVYWTAVFRVRRLTYQLKQMRKPDERKLFRTQALSAGLAPDQVANLLGRVSQNNRRGLEPVRELSEALGALTTAGLTADQTFHLLDKTIGQEQDYLVNLFWCFRAGVAALTQARFTPDQSFSLLGQTIEITHAYRPYAFGCLGPALKAGLAPDGVLDLFREVMGKQPIGGEDGRFELMVELPKILAEFSKSSARETLTEVVARKYESICWAERAREEQEGRAYAAQLTSDRPPRTIHHSPHSHEGRKKLEEEAGWLKKRGF